MLLINNFHLLERWRKEWGEERWKVRWKERWEEWWEKRWKERWEIRWKEWGKKWRKVGREVRREERTNYRIVYGCADRDYAGISYCYINLIEIHVSRVNGWRCAYCPNNKTCTGYRSISDRWSCSAQLLWV